MTTRKSRTKAKEVVEEKMLDNVRKVSKYKRSSPETKQQFINFMFDNLSAIKGLNAKKSTEKLIEMFTQKHDAEVSKAWILSLFKHKLSRQTHTDGSVVYVTNGGVSYEELLGNKKKK